MLKRKLLAIATTVALAVGSFAPTFAATGPERAFPQSDNWTSPAVTPRVLKWGGPVNMMPYWYTEALQRSDMDNAVLNYYKQWREDYFKKSYAGAANGSDVYGVIEGHITGGTSENEGIWKNIELISASEHTGYGMIIFATMAGYPGDNGQCKEDFDALVRTYRQLERPNHLMSWGVPKSYDIFKVAQSSEHLASLPSSATDGDFDVAYALILAEKQWPGQSPFGESYLKMAQDMIDNGIAKDLIDKNSKRILLGDWHSEGIRKGWTPKSLFNPYVTRSSDFMFENLRAFAEYTNSTDNKALFNAAIDECYNILEYFAQNLNSGTGLLPDFMTNIDGKVAAAPQSIYEALSEPFPAGAYSENSCRLPQRLALDFLHSTDPRAKKFTDLLGDFIGTKNGGAWGPVWDKVRDGYMLNGDVIDWSTKPALGKSSGINALQFISGFVSATMVDSSINLGEGFVYLANSHAKAAGAEDPYFKDTLTLMNMLMISGNWWYPAKASTPVNPPVVTEWKLNASYTQGDRVSYNGLIYDCIYTHTAHSETWAPGTPGIWFWQLVK